MGGAPTLASMRSAWNHGTTIDAMYDQAAQKMKLETDRSHALREAITSCGKGGTISIPGVYSGILDKFPLGVAFTKGLKFRMGQTHTQKYMPRLLEAIMSEEIDPTFMITDRISLDDAPPKPIQSLPPKKKAASRS